MDLCIFDWFGFEYPYNEIIMLIKEAGFQSVMTWWGDEHKDTNAGPKESQPEIIRKAGLQLENTHFTFSGVNNLLEDTLDGQEILNIYCSYIDDCKNFGISTAVMHVTDGENPPPYNQLGLDRFKYLIEKAEKNNIIIALENVRKPEYLDYIFENIESNSLRFCYDSGHENCFTQGIDFLAKYGEKLAALHLHDNDGTYDQHLFPFKGTVNWKNIMTQLKKLEYKGSLAFEFDAQYIDVSKEYTAIKYLSDGINSARRLMDILQIN